MCGRSEVLYCGVTGLVKVMYRPFSNYWCRDFLPLTTRQAWWAGPDAAIVQWYGDEYPGPTPSGPRSLPPLHQLGAQIERDGSDTDSVE